MAGIAGAVGGVFGHDSDSDDDGAHVAPANKANSANYSGDLLQLCYVIFSNLLLPFFAASAGAGLLLWDSPSRTVILGHDFNKEWSDLGGKRDKGDRDAWHTASREASEESLGVLDRHVMNKQKVLTEVRAVTAMALASAMQESIAAMCTTFTCCLCCGCEGSVVA